MPDDARVQAANAAVHGALNRIAEEGHDPQHVANVLFAYALKSMVQSVGQASVARHLHAMSILFADSDRDPFGGPSVKH